MKKLLYHIVKEIIPVVAGILIALYINNWNEDRKDRNYMQRIRTSIDKELKASSKDIEEKLVRQKSLIDTLHFYRDYNQVSIDQVLKKAQGIYIPTIRINSWKAISRTKIELMDYERLTALADIEEQRNLLQLKAQKLLDFVYSNYRSTQANDKEFMSIIMREIMSTEQSLIKDISSIINPKVGV